jgi:hypothetical protein
MFAIDPTGSKALLRVDSSGRLLTTGGGGGGSGDATAANQTIQITRLTEIRDKLITAPATEAKQNAIIERLIPPFIVTADDYTNNSAVVKASSGAVFVIYCYNASSTLGYFQIHNKATLPVNTDVPVKSIPVPADSVVAMGTDYFGALGIQCSTGIAWAWSSTRATLTLASGASKTSWIGFA